MDEDLSKITENEENSRMDEVKIIWKKKQDFPFMNGNKILFTFLIRPYLSDRTLGILAGTCRSVREYITKDLETYWFGKYLELYERGSVEKYVRSGPCASGCFPVFHTLYSDAVNLWHRHHLTPKPVYPNWNDPQIYKDNKIWWDDIPVEVGKKLKPHRWFEIRNVYHDMGVCYTHYVPKYHNADHHYNKSKKRKNIDYYKKVIFYHLLSQNKTTRNNRIDKMENEIAKYQRHIDYIQKKIDRLKLERDFINSL